MRKTVLTPSFGHDDFEVVSETSTYQGWAKVDTVQVRHRHFENGEYGPVLTREVVLRREAAGVLLYDSKHQLFALIEQFRVGGIYREESPWHFEVVAGLIDDGETPEQATIREAYEEAGVHIDHLEHVFSFYPTAGGSNEFFHLFAADTDLSQISGIFGEANEGENIKLHVLTYENITPLLHSKMLTNAPVLVAMQWLAIKVHGLTSINHANSERH